MTDVLVRDVPDEVVSALDTRAAQLGHSRSEFRRRRLAREATTALSLAISDLVDFGEMLSTWRTRRS